MKQAPEQRSLQHVAGTLLIEARAAFLNGAALCAKMSETVPTPDITDEGETG